MNEHYVLDDGSSWDVSAVLVCFFVNSFYKDSHYEIKTLAPWKKSYDKPSSILKSRDITLLTKIRTVKAMFFSSSHVWM